MLLAFNYFCFKWPSFVDMEPKFDAPNIKLLFPAGPTMFMSYCKVAAFCGSTMPFVTAFVVAFIMATCWSMICSLEGCCCAETFLVVKVLLPIGTG